MGQAIAIRRSAKYVAVDGSQKQRVAVQQLTLLELFNFRVGKRRLADSPIHGAGLHRARKKRVPPAPARTPIASTDAGRHGACSIYPWALGARVG